MGTKQNPSKFVSQSKEAYPYPSYCGSHKSMIDASVELVDENLVVCKDGFGQYVTERKCLDDGLADQNRCLDQETREKKLKSSLVKK